MNLLIPAYDFSYGGIAGYTYKVACSLARSSHTVWVAADRERSSVIEPAQVPYRRVRLRRRLPRDPRLWLDIPRQVFWARRHGIEGVIVPALFPGGITALGLKRLAGLPYLVMLHGRELNIGTRRAKMLAGAVLKHASVLVPVSRFTASQLRRLYPKAAPMHVVYCGVDTDRFQPAPDREALKSRHGCGGRRVLLTVSRLVRHKGHAQVLQALAEIFRRMPDVLYVIAGAGPEENNIRKAVADQGLHDHVRLLGRVSEDDLPQWHALCDVFVLPTRDTRDTESGSRAVEGFPVVFLEANACGRPVIAGRSGGTVETVQDGITGVVVDGSDVTEVRDAILRLLTDPALADRLGHQGRERVERELSWNRTMQGLEAALQTLSKR